MDISYKFLKLDLHTVFTYLGGAKSGFSDKGVLVTQPPMDQMTWNFDDFYRGKSHLEARTGLASIEVTWPWVDQNSKVTHKSPCMQNLKLFCPLGAELPPPPCLRTWTLPPLFENMKVTCKYWWRSGEFGTGGILWQIKSQETECRQILTNRRSAF